MVSGPVPELLRFTDCAALVVPRLWLPNERLLGESVAFGTVPVPVRATACGLFAALSVMVTDPARLPEALGVKVTLIVQLVLPATDCPQLFVWAKSPVMAMLVMLSGATEVFGIVMVCAGLVVLRFWLPKLRANGLWRYRRGDSNAR